MTSPSLLARWRHLRSAGRTWASRRARSAERTCVSGWVGAFGGGALTVVTVEGR